MEIGDEFNIDNVSFTRDAEYYSTKAKLANKNKLANIFKMLDAAAENGDYSITLTRNFILNEDQVEILENLKFRVDEFEDDDSEMVHIIKFEQ